jgi:hypothetical protein
MDNNHSNGNIDVYTSTNAYSSDSGLFDQPGWLSHEQVLGVHGSTDNHSQVEQSNKNH